MTTHFFRTPTDTILVLLLLLILFLYSYWYYFRTPTDTIFFFVLLLILFPYSYWYYLFFRTPTDTIYFFVLLLILSFFCTPTGTIFVLLLILFSYSYWCYFFLTPTNTTHPTSCLFAPSQASVHGSSALSIYNHDTAFSKLHISFLPTAPLWFLTCLHQVRLACMAAVPSALRSTFRWKGSINSRTFRTEAVKLVCRYAYASGRSWVM
jgi:hypothetical protein